MPKRYGRNQKRHHKEEILTQKNTINQLTKAYHLANELAKYLNEKLSIANSTQAEMISIIESVCKHSIALAPKTILENHEYDRYRIKQTENLDSIYSENIMPNSTFKTIDLYALKLFIEKHYDNFSTAVHLKCLNGKSSTYLISDSALMRMPEEVLIRQFLPEVCIDLARHIKNSYKLK